MEAIIVGLVVLGLIVFLTLFTYFIPVGLWISASFSGVGDESPGPGDAGQSRGSGSTGTSCDGRGVPKGTVRNHGPIRLIAEQGKILKPNRTGWCRKLSDRERWRSRSVKIETRGRGVLR